MEKRLAETERALFFALAEIHAGAVALDKYESPVLRQTMGTSVLSDPTPTMQQDKAKLMASWVRTPLADRGQVHAWFEANQGEAEFPSSMYLGADVARGSDTVTRSTSSTVLLSGSGQPAFIDTADSNPEMLSSSGSRPEGDTPSARGVSPASKASNYAKANTSIYF